MKVRLLLLGSLALTPAALGQSVFAALGDGSPKMVKVIHGHQPLIEAAPGKLASASGSDFTFLRATIYRPGLVTLDDFHVRISSIEDVNSGGRFNYELHIQGRAKSDTTFRNCFMVLEMTAWKSHGVAFAEMPDLPAGESAELNLNFSLADKIEEGSYRVHVFSDGIEVLHSKLSAAYLSRQKQKTEALLSGKTQDFDPILERSVKAVYPEALNESPKSGSAKVRCQITKNGDVASPELVSASDPAFGEAALAAVVKWKFDPALKARKLADTTIVIPFEFRPPKS